MVWDRTVASTILCALSAHSSYDDLHIRRGGHVDVLGDVGSRLVPSRRSPRYLIESPRLDIFRIVSQEQDVASASIVCASRVRVPHPSTSSDVGSRSVPSRRSSLHSSRPCLAVVTTVPSPQSIDLRRRSWFLCGDGREMHLWGGSFVR